MTDATDSKGRYCFVTLGCPKNLVDSEKMLGTLSLDGYTLVSHPEGADFVIVNTCGFIEASRQESKSVIREMIELKQAGRLGGVIVAGCLPQRIGPALLDELPGIDHVVGVFSRDEIAKAAERLAGGRTEQRTLFRPAPVKALDDRARLRITPRHYAYLKISEGCDRTCTFCAIPKMRGKHVTKPIEMVLEEARELAGDGVKELILVAQDTTYYGLDLYGRVRLADLLRELDQIDGIEWIRLMYLYPIHFGDDLIDTIAGSAKVLPYLDLPLQHISDPVLKRMQRRVNRAQSIELVEKLRERIPGVVLRTTFITGFPGETDAQFQELHDFVADARFERMGVFTYSREPGTPAEKLDGHLPEAVKEERRDALMELQQEIAFEFADSLIDAELQLIVDAHDAESGLYECRSYGDAPEIDTTVYVEAERLKVGQFCTATVVARQDYDLVGTVGAAAE